MGRTNTFAISVDEFRLVISALEAQRDEASVAGNEEQERLYIRIIWKFEKLLKEVEKSGAA
jgi:hypothetical protein